MNLLHASENQREHITAEEDGSALLIFTGRTEGEMDFPHSQAPTSYNFSERCGRKQWLHGISSPLAPLACPLPSELQVSPKM